MAELFLISDTHFGHEGILQFKTDGGHPLRSFASLIEMHAAMIERWNRVVTPKDKVYHLGDVAMSREGLKIVGLLNGKKRLVRGNHDLYKLSHYREFFHEVYGVRQLNGLWLTHVPMHPECVENARGNIHGHLHAGRIDHPKYINVSVERIKYTPVSMDQIEDALRWGHGPYT